MHNICLLAQRFGAAGFSTVVADVVMPRTLTLYRELLPGCLVIRLRVTPAEARPGSWNVELSHIRDHALTTASERASPYIGRSQL
ncbi:hypothetical protein [Actinopolymorpha pittospori]